MCGIAGIISPYASFVSQQRLKQMADTLQHRGPDGEGYWISKSTQVGMAHRRLSILDLSDAGAQPLHYLHYTLLFNGEIYNYRELKENLRAKGYTFKTGSDTEVIPAAFDCWGNGFLQKLDGMFALALWDDKNKQMLLARDRFGEKPLYYYADYRERGHFVEFIFASEMKALWAVGAPRKLNGTMMLNYLTLGYVQNPNKKMETFYANILSLPPGHFLLIQPHLGRVQMRTWYRLDFSTDNAPQDAVSHFRELLSTSVSRRLRSDVPVGTSLSGGIDSSAIAAFIGRSKEANLFSHKAFSAVFPGFEKDESAYSLQAAEACHMQRYTVTPTGKEMADQLGRLAYMQEEPMQSSSVFLQYCVYRLAKENGITVLLDGQGADEILGGYTRYTQWYLQSLLTTGFRRFRTEKKQLKAHGFLPEWGIKNDIAAFFPEKTARWLQRKAIRTQKNHPFLNPEFLERYQNSDTLLKPVISRAEDLMYYNTTRMGLEELLRYADRNAMAFSREVRLPFLQHELVEYAFSLPASFKFHQGFTKWILRESVSGLLPESLIWRPGKTGYEPPQKKWMREPPIIEQIQEARRQLVKEKVLLPKILDTPVKAEGAHDRNATDWRYLSASFCL